MLTTKQSDTVVGILEDTLQLVRDGQKRNLAIFNTPDPLIAENARLLKANINLAGQLLEAQAHVNAVSALVAHWQKRKRKA